MEEKGLTFDSSSVKVFVGDEVTGTKIDASNYTVVTSPTDGCTFEIVFDDLKKSLVLLLILSLPLPTSPR